MAKPRPALPAGRGTPFMVYVARFMVGHHLDGKRRSDATFFARGTERTEPHWFGRRAHWWSLLPGWQRAAIRLLPLALAVGWWTDRPATEWAAAAVLGPLAGLLAWRLAAAVQHGRHMRVTVRPLAAALAPALETSPADVERTLYVPRPHLIGERDAEVSALLPDHHQGTAAQTDAVARIIGQRLGGEWQARVMRSPLAVVATHRPEPPRRVDFADVAELIRSQGSLYRPLMGLGADHDPVWLDFRSDVAHLGASVTTGGGKSAFLRYLLAVFAYFGCADFPCLDSKGVSLAGMERLPGLAVYREAAEQWALLAELRRDMDERYRLLLADPSATFPPCVLLCDEMNDAAIEWRALWRSIKAASDPATPPVYDDLTRLLIKGRQVGYRVIGVYQRLSAAACGGMDAGLMRDAYGQKCLARFSPQAWDSLTGLRPRAPSSAIPGRWVSVLGNSVRQVQVPYGEPDELVSFALASPMLGVPVPRDVAPLPLVSANVPAPAGTATAADPGLVVGLDAAADVLSMSYEGFRKARQRRPIDGEISSDGRPAWPVAALAEWRGGAHPELSDATQRAS